MTSQDALLAHIVGRVQADIDFLVSQNVISPVDGQAMAPKLPQSGQHAPGLIAPPTPAPTPAAARRVVPRPPPPPPPPPAPVPRVSQARALWEYNADGHEAGDLSFNAGDIIEILEEVNADWWKGKNSRGQTGLFPANYVEKMAGVAAPPAPSYPVPGRVVAPAPNEKYSYDPMAAPPPPQTPEQEQQAVPPPKKGKFGKFGNTMAQSAAGGVGFGAGAAVGSGIINAIF